MIVRLERGEVYLLEDGGEIENGCLFVRVRTNSLGSKLLVSKGHPGSGSPWLSRQQSPQRGQGV